MSQHLQASLSLLRWPTREQWSAYFDLFCTVSIGVTLRPALVSAAPLLISIWERFFEMWTRGCIVRSTIATLSKANKATAERTLCTAGLSAQSTARAI